MKVLKLVFREMGSYNDLPIRPLTTSFNGRHQAQLAEVTRDGFDLEPTVLSGLAGQIIRPSSKVEGVANIVSGWGEPRLFFMMECEIYRSRTAVTVEYITGYTNYVGISTMDSRNASVDEEMTLHFSDTFQIRTLQAMGRGGMETVYNMHDAAQILSRQSRADLSVPRGSNGSITVRPEDLFVRKTVPEQFISSASSAGYRDMRSSFNKGMLKLSRKTNTQPSVYLSRTLKAFKNSEPDDFVVDPNSYNDNDRFVAARGMVKEQLISADPVFEDLMRDTDIMRDGYVTYGQLLAMNPDLDNIVDVVVPGRGYRPHSRGDSASWGDPDNETIAATIISNTVTTYLMELMYSGVHFFCTNDTPGGMFETRISKLTPFVPNADIDGHFNRLISRIEHELMPDLVLNREMVLAVEVMSLVYGDTTIRISIDHDEEREYVFPTFCSAVASPMVTDSMNTLDTLAKDIGDIAEALSGYSSAPSTKRPGTTRGKTL